MTAPAGKMVVLGSGGFIGGRLLRLLTEAGAPSRGFSAAECDLLSWESADKALSCLTGADTLVLAAAVTRLKENSFDSMVKNLRMVENAAEAAARRPPGQVIFLSTVDVYGVDPGPGVKLSERLPLVPNDHYAVSKAAGELLLLRTCARLGVPLTVLRLSGVYGPGDAGKSTIGNFIGKALKGGPLTIYGSGSALRDFVYVDDVCALIRAAAARPARRTLNVATGASYSIRRIAELVREASPVKFEILFGPAPAGGDRRIEDMVYDVSALKAEFPGVPLRAPADGIRKCFELLANG